LIPNCGLELLGARVLDTVRYSSTRRSPSAC